MTVKIKALAEKLGLTSKEIVNKAVSMGIEAKTANSSIEESDAQKIEAVFRESGAHPGDETKVVSGSGKKTVAEDKGESKVQLKTAKILKPAGRKASAKTEQKKETSAGRMMPIGRPITKAESESRRRHIGTPITKAEKEAKEEQRRLAEEAEKKAAEAAAKAKASEAAEALEDAGVEKEPPKKKAEHEEPRFRGPKVIKKAEDIAREEKERAQKKEKSSSSESSEKKAERKSDRKAEDRRRNSRKDERSEEKAADRKKKRESQEKFAAAPVSEKSDSRKSKRKDKDRDRDRDREDGDERRGRKNRNSGSHYGEKSLEKKEKKKKKQKNKQQEVEVEVEMEQIPAGTKVINVPITVAGYCEQVGISVSQVIMTLMKLGIVTNINANLDEDTVVVLSEELGVDVVIGEVEEEIDEGLELFEDKEEDLVGRPPIITVMGHVDHGKTSLLDAIRATNVTAKESGGITQHIGASEVRLNGQKIVFLDTPGHEAFTAMRARGADITDIAVLVVAADDSVKPQTIESISHAKAAGVPIIVAINKMDKPGANPDLVKKDLADNGVLVEEWGGDVISVPVSAKTGMGIENLLEMILLQAEVLELKANPKRLGLGTVIEARLDKAKGPVATLLVTNGTVKSGQSLVAGNTSGRIRLMTDFKGTTIKKAGPATAVEILGLSDVPAAGDDFHVVKDDKTAREIAERRMEKFRKEVLARNASSTLEELFSQIREGEIKDLNLIIKADVRGSVGAVVSSLEKLSNDEVRVKIIHSGVGAITESDVTLASTAGAIIIGFNVRPATGVQGMADRENVQIRTYRVIYNIIDDVENAMKGMLDPEFKEVVLGQAEVRDTFKVPGVGTIGGCYVTEGKVARNAEVRIVRDGIVIHEGKISSLKRFKDDAKEVLQGYECGIGIENYNDVKEGDVIECFQMEEVERK